MLARRTSYFVALHTLEVEVAETKEKEPGMMVS